MRWRSATSDEFLWAEWDREFVVFHRPSGQTHFVNAASAALLRDILVDPMDALDASRALAGQTPDAPEPDADFARHVFGLLVRFEELGLVVRVSP
ncbi:MAG TPA: HPr-rel-A system PqqD family peptide chaperone [Burkholderiaceae bacterium]|nr:HPr-rel-A system PqqD family peptide chaperone [Burkholderiaceae bacterium]